MSELQITTRMRLQAGRLERFKRQAIECIRQAAVKDVGTLRYDWFISRDGAMCEVREAYSGPEALLLHRTNLAEAVDRLVTDFVEERVTTAYGETSPQLVRLADVLGSSVTWYSLFGGLSRRFPAPSLKA
jgi:quinol monooxygenase YgiN